MPNKEINQEESVYAANFVSVAGNNQVGKYEHEISTKAFESIIRHNVLRIPGVVRFTSTSLRGSIADMVGRKTQESSVIIVHNEDDSIDVGVVIIACFDVSLPELMNSIEDVVRSEVTKLTSVIVKKVRVCIQDIVEMPKDENTENKEEEILN